MKLSVTLATFNEEKNIARCLQAVKNLANEIVIVDGTSTDKTVAITKSFGARVQVTSNPPVFHINKQKANDLAKGEWILQLDADEVVTSGLKEEIKSIINRNPEENGFWLPRANYFLGRFLRKGGAYPDYTLRLYRRSKGKLPCKSVHEQAKVEGKVGYLHHDLLHYGDPTFGHYITRFNRYTDLAAHEVSGGLFANLVWKPLFDKEQGFLTIYLRHLGFLDGFPGFVWALFSALNFPIAYFKSIDIKEGRAKQMCIGFVKPPNTGNLTRGVGVYATNLYTALKEEGVVVSWLNFSYFPVITQNCDIIHYPYFDPFFLTLPLVVRIKSVVTVHDLTPLIFPQGFPRGLKGQLKWQIQKISLQLSTAIVTVSDASKRDIIRLANIPQDKVYVTYEAAGKNFRPISDSQKLLPIKKKYQLPDNFILYVGDINFNKNISGLLSAFKRFHDGTLGKNYALVLVGGAFKQTGLVEAEQIRDQIKNLDITTRVIFPGQIPSQELAAFYNLTSVYVQPSIYEGFGLPVVEALSCGCPVVCGSNSSLPEVAGKAAVYADVENPNDLAEKISQVVKNGRERYQQTCLAQARKFSWQKTAKDTLKVYEKVLAGE